VVDDDARQPVETASGNVELILGISKMENAWKSCFWPELHPPEVGLLVLPAPFETATPRQLPRRSALKSYPPTTGEFQTKR
jgi:hypothetical protein